MRKKSLPLIGVVVAVLLLSTSACKDAVFEITWSNLEGSGTYNSLDNTSTIKLSGSVEIDIPTVITQQMWAKIYAWEFIIRQGEQLVLYLNSDNNYDVLGDHTINKSEEQTSLLWLELETQVPKPGDLYDGATPDSVELILYIADSDENTYSSSNVGSFTLTRD